MQARRTKVYAMKDVRHWQPDSVVPGPSMHRRASWRLCRHNAGFTLIELMIATVIITILALMAVPSVLAYRYKSRVAALTATTKQIQGALANYAMDTGGGYPANVGDWQALKDIVNRYSSLLPDTPTQIGIQAIAYSSTDETTYTLQITVDVPEDVVGKTFVITPTGITKQ